MGGDKLSSEEDVQEVWEKGKTATNYDKNKYRKDQCDAWMKRDKHGDRDSKLGWEIHHVDPDGGDATQNLAPLQWENNVAPGDGKLKCVVTSKENKNVKT